MLLRSLGHYAIIQVLLSLLLGIVQAIPRFQVGIEGSLLEFFAQAGIGGVIALVALYYARRDALQHKEEIKAHKAEYKIVIDQLAALQERTLTLVQMNVDSLSGWREQLQAIANYSRIEERLDRLDRLDKGRTRGN